MTTVTEVEPRTGRLSGVMSGAGTTSMLLRGLTTYRHHLFVANGAVKSITDINLRS